MALFSLFFPSPTNNHQFKRLFTVTVIEKLRKRLSTTTESMVVKETVFVSAFRHNQKIEDLGLGEPFYNLIIQLVRKGVHTATQGLSRSGDLRRVDL